MYIVNNICDCLIVKIHLFRLNLFYLCFFMQITYLFDPINSLYIRFIIYLGTNIIRKCKERYFIHYSYRHPVGGNLCCCCLLCDHCSNWTWVAEEILAFGNRLRSTHCRQFNYLKLCRPTYFVRTTQLL